LIDFYRSNYNDYHTAERDYFESHSSLLYDTLVANNVRMILNAEFINMELNNPSSVITNPDGPENEDPIDTA